MPVPLDRCTGSQLGRILLYLNKFDRVENAWKQNTKLYKLISSLPQVHKC